MKKNLISFLFIILLSFAYPLYAQSVRVITLKDGSVIKGEILRLEDHAYTVETPNLGKVQIPEADILTIASEQPATQPPASQFESRTNQMQADILSDPALLSDVQAMMQDQETMAIFSDPKLMEDIMSRDPAKIESNPKVQTLLQNPHMQALIQKIQAKTSAQK